MKIYLVSGDGAGAGKTTFAELLVGKAHVWSIAGAMRQELQQLYPEYDWFNKSQEYKQRTVVDDYKRGYTVREVLQEYGQEKCQHYPTYWVERLVDRIQQSQQIAYGPAIAIDDVRKVCEVDYIKSKLENWTHWHVANYRATFEPLFDNPQLAKIANYVVRWC